MFLKGLLKSYIAHELMNGVHCAFLIKTNQICFGVKFRHTQRQNMSFFLLANQVIKIYIMYRKNNGLIYIV